MNAMTASLSPRKRESVPGSRRRRSRTVLLVAVLVVGMGVSTSANAWVDFAALAQRVALFIQNMYQQILDYKEMVDQTKTQIDSLKTQVKINDVGRGDFDSATASEKAADKPDVTFKSSEVPAPSSSGMAKLSSVVLSEDEYCEKPDESIGDQAANTVGMESIPAMHNKVCHDILDTQRAQFKYNVMMSEVADQRFKRLEEIKQQRAGISDAGQLQDNTNKMLALIALIQIDQQQQKSYNDAYNTRLTYLRSVQDRLTQKAINGSGKTGVNEIVGGVAEYATLAAALGVASEVK